MNIDKRIRLAAAGAVLAAMSLSGAGSAYADTTPINVGIAVRDITPTLPIMLGGYGPDHLTKKMDSRLSVTAIALSNEAGQPVVFVAADIMMFAAQFTAPVLQILAQKDGLTPSQVMFVSSHTHGAPALPTTVERPGQYMEYVAQARNLSAADREHNIRYGKSLQKTLVEVVEAALADRSPATLRYGVGRATFAVNRRLIKEGNPLGGGNNFDGPVDWDVPVLEIKGTKGELRAVIFGYACHGTTLGREADSVSADYIGYTRQELAAVYPGVVTAYLDGFAGDSNPYPGVGVDQHEDGTYTPMADGGIMAARRHGLELAGAVSSVLARPMQPITGKVSLAYQEVDLPLSAPPPLEQIEKETTAEDPSPSKQAAMRAQFYLDAYKKGETPIESVRMPLAVVRIGDRFVLLAVGGEVVADYGVRLKRMLAPENPWFVSMAYYSVSYIPSARIIKEGGFEPEASMRSYGMYGPYRLSVEDIIVNKLMELAAPRAAQ